MVCTACRVATKRRLMKRSRPTGTAVPHSTSTDLGKSAAAASCQPDLASLLLQHGPALRRYLRVLGCALDLIEDLVQECFLIALRTEFRHIGTAAARTFFRQTAKNLFRNQLRSDRRQRDAEIADEVWHSQCGNDDGDGYLAALRECLQALPERQRALIEGCYCDDLGRTQLAQKLGMRPEGIKTALRRLRTTLRTCVERKRMQS